MKKIKLVYDATVIFNILKKDSSRSGIFFVAYNVLLELLKHPEFDIYLYAEDILRLRKIIEVCPEFSNCKICKFSELQEWIGVWTNLKNKNREQNNNVFLKIIYGIVLFILKRSYVLVRRYSNMKDIDVFLSPMNAVPKFIRRKKYIKSYTIIHDVIPLLYNKTINYSAHKWFYKLVDAIDSESYYFANSEYTKQDFIKYIPKIKESNITVIPLSMGKPYTKIDDVETVERVKQKYNITAGKKYIFSLCNLNPRKNLIFAIKNFLRFVDKNQLEDFIFVLGGAQYEDFTAILNENIENLQNQQDKILRIGYVDDEDVSALYSGAEMFLYPSLYEGFGMPILEAMNCGLPVICSNCTSIPEVIGDCGIQINPHSDEDMLAAMEKMYFDREFRSQCIQKGFERAKLFTWEKCGNIIARVILEGKGCVNKKDICSYANV